MQCASFLQRLYKDCIAACKVVGSVIKIGIVYFPSMAEKVSETAKIFCCNPFKKDRHQGVKRSVRPVTDWMCDMFDTIVVGMKICDSCRKELSKQKQVTDTTDDCLVPVANTTRPTNVDESFVALDVTLEYLNKSLSSLEESPVAKRKLQMKSYCDKKYSKIKKCLTEKVLTAASTNTEKTVDHKSESCEVICQLKEKFQEENISVSEKLQILTVLPKSWSCSEIQNEFQVSNRMARKAKALVKAKGILATPNPKPGKVLNESVIEKVIGFYNSDDVSRLMPGKKDFVSVKTGDSSRIHVQKRLVMGNLKEVYELFKNKNPTDKIGFSKFADLRPKHCVLAGGSGTHTVCVCTVHQNVKLMLQVLKSKQITLNDGTDISNYNSCLAKLMCEEPGTACHLNECPSCPGVDNLKDELQLLLDNELVDNITYKQWVSVDRCNLVTFIKTADEFIETLCEQLLILKRHSFIARRQAEYYNHLKQNIGVNEAVVCMDFAENYSFVLQDEAQSFHWNNDQATIFPIAVYYNDHNIHYKSIVCISECLQHDTTAVHLFQKRLISHLKLEVIRDLKKIYYFSDGAAAQFKNRKNFSNLCHHVHDFGIEAEWHFYATAHGKGVCDGLGGTVKRLAGKASLQRPYEHQIMTPAQLFTWSEENIDSMQFFFFNEAQYNKEEKILADRFLSTKAIPGTQKFHSFIPLSDKVLLTKVFSRSEQSSTFSVLGPRVQQRLKLAEVKGYVTCENNNHWWLGVVVDKNETAQIVELMFLHPAGPSPSFTFKSDCPNKLTVPLSQILTLVQPTCPTGRSYYLSKEEMDAATMALENYCRQ